MTESQIPKEPHLLDLSNLVDVAQWIVLAAASGVIGNMAYDLLKNIGNRFGPSRLQELEAKTYELVDQARTDEHITPEQIRERIRRLFEELD